VRYLKMSLITVMMTIVALSAAHAEETNIAGSASADVMSNYVWRGQKLSNASVVQPSVGITYGGFGANLWANYDTDTNEHNETDLTLSYSFPIDKLGIDVGYIYYGLEGVNDTQEIYLAVSYDVLLRPSLTVYYDFDQGDGSFIVASIGHSFELTDKVALNLGASGSYNGKNAVMGTDSGGDKFSGFYNGELSASVGVQLTKAISIEPKIAYSFPLSRDAKDAIKAISDDGDKNIIYGGVNVTLSF
jgi:hypothetical protein